MNTSLPATDLSPLSPFGGGACALPGLGVIRATGTEAASFLHGQLSNDVQRLDAAHARLGAYCTPQGRMLASLVYARHGAEIWLACSADLLAPTLKRLSMFVMRAQAKLSDASAELAVVGLGGAAAAAWVAAQAPAAADAVWAKADGADDAIVLRLPDAQEDAGRVARWLWIGPAAAAEALRAALPALTAAQWQALEVRAGVAPVVAATAGQFVPQMLNYELVGGVDFKKGCYPGQEIVARSQYLGKLKRRAFLLTGTAPMTPGQEVFWSGDPGQPAGVVAAAAVADDGTALALAELKLAATTAGGLTLGAADGPALQLGALPYALPTDAAA
jgi:hypothetical protein